MLPMSLSLTFHELWASVQDDKDIEILAYVVQFRVFFSYVRVLSHIRVAEASPTYLKQCLRIMEVEMVSKCLRMLRYVAHTFQDMAITVLGLARIRNIIVDVSGTFWSICSSVLCAVGTGRPLTIDDGLYIRARLKIQSTLLQPK